MNKYKCTANFNDGRNDGYCVKKQCQWYVPGKKCPFMKTKVNFNFNYLRKKYTQIKSYAVKGEPEVHTVGFVVGDQGFRITPEGCKTREDAEFMQKMLTKAIYRLLKEEREKWIEK